MKLFGGTGVLGGVLGTKGYTIVEVMIFLVISGGLLVSVLGAISGQQQKTRFQTGVRDFESQLQDTLNDVETGYYSDTTGNAGEGGASNAGDKIFIGKGIQFYKSPSTGENTSWRETTIQAEAKVGDKDVTQLTDTGADIKSNDIFADHELLNGVELTGIWYGPNTNDKQFGIAIVSGISSDGKKSNGSRGQLAKLEINSSVNDGNLLKGAIIGLGTTVPADNPIANANNGVIFCLREGGGGRIAAVALGLAYDGANIVPTGQKNISTTYFDKDAEDLGCTNA